MPETDFQSLAPTFDSKMAQDIERIIAELDADWPRRDARPPMRIDRMGRFENLEQIGGGGMGVVFRAFDPRSGQHVAVKVPTPGRLGDPKFRRRFHLEASVGETLQHPNIARFREFGEDGLYLFIVSDFCDGPNLADWLRVAPEPMPPRSAAHLALTLAKALAYAHESGILHRDLKPSNVLLPGGWVERNSEKLIPILTDFGLAKIVDPALYVDQTTYSGPISAPGAILGSPPYIAPEQARGDNAPPGPWIDVYGLGALLYELLVGRPPFRGINYAETLRAVIQDEPVPPGVARRGVPRDLETIMLKCLEKKPSDRYRSMNELAGDLERYLNREPIRARPPSIPKRAIRWGRRHPGLIRMLAAAALAATILAGLGVGWNLRLKSLNEQVSRERDHATRLNDRLEALNKRVSRERDRATQLNYAFQIQRASEAGQPGRSQRVLRDLIPAPGERDHREFAWRYLWASSRREASLLGEMETSTTRLTEWATSRDGRWLAGLSGDGDWALFDTNRGGRTHYSRREARHVRRNIVVSDRGGLVAAAFVLDGEQRHSEVLRLQVWNPLDDTVRDLSTSIRDQDFEGLFFNRDDQLFLLARSSVVEKGIRVSVLAKYDPRARTDPVLVQSIRLASQAYNLEAVAPDRATCVGLGHEGVLGIYEMESFEMRARFQQVPSSFRTDRVNFSRDGRRVCVCDYDTRRLGIWDTQSGKLLHSSEGLQPDTQIILQPAGQAYLAINPAREIRLIDPSRKSNVLILPSVSHLGVGTWARHVAFTADGGGILVLREPYMQPGIVELRSAKDGKKIAESPARQTGALGSWHVMDASQGGPALVYGEGRCLWRWDWERTLARSDAEPPMRHSDEVWAVAYSPDRSLLATGSNDSTEDTTIKVWNARTRQFLHGWKGHNATVTGLAFSPDGGLLASSSLSVEAGVRLWNVGDGSPIASLDWPNVAARAIAFDRSGRFLAAVGNAGTVCVWKMPERAKSWASAVGREHIHAVAFSPDGNQLATGGHDSVLQIWEVASGVKLAETRLASEIYAIAYDPSGKEIAAATKEGEINLLDSRTLSVRQLLHGDGVELRSLGFSPDGRTLAAGGAGQALRLWDPETGHELLTLIGHQAQVNAVAFSPDGSELASVDHSGIIRIWEGPAVQSGVDVYEPPSFVTQRGKSLD